MTGELTSKSHSKFRVITVNNWNEYQGNDKQNDKQVTRKRQASDNQMTTIEEIKEYKEKEEVKEVKNIYGEYKHVKLTQKEFDRLVNDYGELETLEAIKFLDEYIQEKPGYKSKDHNLAMRRWVFNAVREWQAKNKPTQETNVFDAWANA